MPTNVADRELSGNDISVHLCKQTDKGSVNTNPEFTEYRRTEGTGKTTVGYSQSSMVSSSRQGRPQIQERSEHTSELSSEANKEAIDNLISAIHATEVVFSDTDTDYAATGTGFTSGSGAFSAVIVGDYIWASNFADSSINTLYRITAKADNNTISTYPAPAATESAGASVTMTSRKSVNAKDQTYYTLQTRTLDKSKAADTDYHTLYDGIINTMSLEIPDSGICSSSLSMMFESKVSGTAAISGQTDAATPTDDSISAVQNVKNFFIDGVTQLCMVKSLSLEVNNNYSTSPAAGCQGLRATMGDIDVSGSIVVASMISSPFTWRDYHEGGQTISVAVHLDHDEGGETVIVMRSCKVTEHSMPNGSSVAAVSEGSLGVEEDATTNTTIEIFRNWS